MTIKLQSPHPFSERLLLFGGGGVGKTHACLSIAEHVTGRMFVLDSDYSGAYERAIATDFQDCADRVEVHEVAPDWASFMDAVSEVISEADPAKDWIVIDPVTGSYDWVQEWVLEQVHGGDLARMLMDLRKAHPDSKEYAAARANLMNWELVKKEYGKLWRAIQQWKGHLVLIAEAKALSSNERDDETAMLFGPLGFKPAGAPQLKHVAATTLLLSHPKRGVWQATTIKDRNREELDREDIDEFAIDYLQLVAGWKIVK